MGQSRPQSRKPSFGTLVDALRWWVERSPDAVIHRFLPDGETERTSCSYGELHNRSVEVAERVVAMGDTGRPVLLIFLPGVEFLVAFVGCLYAGAIAVPVPAFGSRRFDRLAAIASDAGAQTVITSRRLAGRLQNASITERFGALMRIVVVEEVGAPSVSTFREPSIDSSAIAFIQYTSGSTLAPRGAVISHGNLVHNLQAVAGVASSSPADVGITWLPHFHDMGLIDGLLAPLYCGYPVVQMPPESFIVKPHRWLEAITRYHGTKSGGPMSAYRECVRRIGPDEREHLDLSSWRQAYCAAEPIRVDELRRFAELFRPCGFRATSITACYGLAEATLAVSLGHPGDFPHSTEVRPEVLRGANAPAECTVSSVVNCGPPIGGQQVVVVDAKTRDRVPDGKVGEIWVKGDSNAQGYWNRPMETETTFMCYLGDSGEGPYLNTGDLGFVVDGEIHVVGRSKDLIILNGQNHYPQDIEATARRVVAEGVAAEGAAFSIDHEGTEVLVVAHEVPRKGASAEFPALAQKIREAVSEICQVVVHAVVLVKPGGIPRTSSGKVQRNLCRKRFLSGRLPVVAVWRSGPGPASELGAIMPSPATLWTRRSLAAWIRERIAARVDLVPSTIAFDEPLSRYGLRSVDAVSLAQDVGLRLGLRVEPTLVYDHPSIDALTSYLLDELEPTRGRSVVASGSSPPRMCPEDLLREVETGRHDSDH